MCDTCGIGPALTSSGISIFGKNSDREPDETHLVVSVPSKTYPSKENLQCTYIAIPQTDKTFAAVLSKPFWMWGAEMGVNEKGVVIGNEALFTKIKPEKTPGLIAMDLLRLALERTANAEDAAQLIIDLLKKYGQAGPCGYRDKKFSYMNSFIIMDRQGIIKLETVGRDYALQRSRDHAEISNGITIARDWDNSSFEAGTDFSKFSDRFITYFAGSTFRKDRNRASILNSRGAMTSSGVFSMLRSHYEEMPGRGFNRDVCMHASDPLIRKSQTTGSLVVELHPEDKFRIFVTGGSSPCLTAFKPFVPAAPFADLGIGDGHYSDRSFWWRHEAFRANAMLRYENVLPEVQKYILESEAEWTAKLPAYTWNSADASLTEISLTAFIASDRREKAMMERMKKIRKTAPALLYKFWQKMARRAGVPLI